MFFRMKMEENIELCIIFRLTLMAENKVRAIGIHVRVKFNLFKGTIVQIEKALAKDCLHVSKVS